VESHTRDRAFAGRLSSPFPVSLLVWGIVIANPAGTGRLVPSMLSPCGAQKPYRSTQGADNIGTYNKTPQSSRKWCKTCGGHIFTEHPNLTDVYAAVFPQLPFQPGVHVHYQETVLHVKDGLPKMKDVPAEMGGSGDTLAE